MSGMNPWLASIYGTDGADDLEKTAQAHLLQKLAAEGNIDISQFTPEELEQLVQELAAEGYDVGALMQPQGAPQQQPQMPGAGNPMPQQQGMGFAPNPMQQQQRPQAFAPANQQPQMPQGMNPQMMQQPQGGGADATAMQKEAQAKFEEADLLGRVMAHAYTDELEKIASHRKTAGGRVDAAKNAIKGVAGKARDAAAHAHGTARGYAGRAAEHVKANKGAYAGGAAAAGAGFAAGRMSKKASAFEKLAEEHAAEILSATGYDPSTGQDMYGQQMLQNAMPQQQPQTQQMQQPQMQQGVEQPPVDQQNPQFTEALDQRALELLAENGYDVNEIMARIELAQRQQPVQA